MIDFTKAKIGLKVNDPTFGNGILTTVDTVNKPYIIGCLFNLNNITQYFTSDGRFHKTSLPTLRVGHFPPLDQGVIPEKKPKPLKFDGIPKWAYVSDSEDGFKRKVKRIVIAGNKVNGWVAMYYGDNTSTSTVINWNYAWEIEE